jgi:hypothetical protein
MLGFFLAKPTEYSPFPQPNSTTMGFLFLKKVDQAPLCSKDWESKSALLG